MSEKKLRKTRKLVTVFLPMLIVWGAITLLSIFFIVASMASKDPEAFLLLDGLGSITFALGFLARIVIGIVFFVWLVKVTKIARSLATEKLAFYPAWNVISFFIPFVNLVVPYIEIKKIWRQSKPKDKKEVDKHEKTFILWWAFWIVFYVLESAEDLITVITGRLLIPSISNLLYILSSLALLATAPFFYKMMVNISEAQDKKLD